MACSSPVEICRYVYSPSHGGRIKRYFLVPCGKCISCLKVRQMQYAFRAEWEALDPRSVVILFCTFTYAPEYLLDNELSKVDVQRYIRRLRKSLPGVRVRYLFCGEYGELYGRKHYHAILYFDKFIDFHYVADNWPFGIVDIAPFTTARAGYVAKYSVKQIGSLDEENHIIQPFLLVSNQLGFYFLDKYGDFCRREFVFSWSNLSGFNVLLPRVFMERLFPPTDKAHVAQELVSGAARSYASFVGDIRSLRLRKKCAYDSRIKIQSTLSGKSEARFVGEVQLGVSFKSKNSFDGILSRVAYETGRYSA